MGSPEGPGAERRRWPWWAVPALFGAALGVAAAGVAIALSGGPAPVPVEAGEFGRGGELVWEPGERPAPPVELRDLEGRSISLESLPAGPLVLAFLNSRCTDICPIEGRQLAELSTLPGSERPTVVAVSVNPRETPASVRRAAEAWGWQQLRWTWLLGSKAELAATWRTFNVYVRPSGEPGQVEHTGAMYLLDAERDVRAAYVAPIPMARLLGDLEVLHGE